MKQKDFKKYAKSVFKTCLKTLTSKGKEYSEDDNVFSNFEDAIGLSLDIESREVVAYNYLLKHLQSIKDILKDVEEKGIYPSKELTDEKFKDAINYLVLIKGMLDEN